MKKAIIKDYFMTEYTTLIIKNLDQIKKYKLNRSKTTGYGLAKKRKIRKEDLLLWKLKWVKVISNHIFEKTIQKIIVKWQKKTEVGYRLFQRSGKEESQILISYTIQ